jgi:hypothetical protein
MAQKSSKHPAKIFADRLVNLQDALIRHLEGRGDDYTAKIYFHALHSFDLRQTLPNFSLFTEIQYLFRELVNQLASTMEHQYDSLEPIIQHPGLLLLHEFEFYFYPSRIIIMTVKFSQLMLELITRCRVNERLRRENMAGKFWTAMKQAVHDHRFLTINFTDRWVLQDGYLQHQPILQYPLELGHPPSFKAFPLTPTIKTLPFGRTRYELYDPLILRPIALTPDYQPPDEIDNPFYLESEVITPLPTIPPTPPVRFTDVPSVTSVEVASLVPAAVTVASNPILTLPSKSRQKRLPTTVSERLQLQAAANELLPGYTLQQLLTDLKQYFAAQI